MTPAPSLTLGIGTGWSRFSASGMQLVVGDYHGQVLGVVWREVITPLGRISGLVLL